MSLTWANVRDNTELALIIAGVLALGSMALDMRAVTVELASLGQRVERIERKQDNHMRWHHDHPKGD